jgi:hypothetical protein
LPMTGLDLTTELACALGLLALGVSLRGLLRR